MDLLNVEILAGAGLLATCWRQLLSVANRLRSLLIIRVDVHGEAGCAIQAYCWANYKRSPFGDRLFRSFTLHVRPLNKMQSVAAETPPVQPIIFFDGWRPVMLGGGVSNPQYAFPEQGLAVLTVIRGMIDVEALLTKAVTMFNAKKGVNSGNRYRVQRASGYRRRRGGETPQGYDVHNGKGSASQTGADNPLQSGYRFLIWQPEDLGPQNPPNPMNNLALAPVLDKVRDAFQRWIESEEWYRGHGVPWRRGLGLLGRPGSGKTSFVRALAQQYDLPLYVFDLSSLSNEEMNDAWRTMQESSPCIALFEDLDGTFDGRQNRLGEQGGGLTFDCLLNCIGGVETCDGVYTVVTTNHPQSLDPALGVLEDGKPSRPGRLDDLVEMPDFSRECRLQTAQRILGDWPELVESVVERTEGQTAAQVTETCVTLALARYWEEPQTACRCPASHSSPAECLDSQSTNTPRLH